MKFKCQITFLFKGLELNLNVIFHTKFKGRRKKKYVNFIFFMHVHVKQYTLLTSEAHLYCKKIWITWDTFNGISQYSDNHLCCRSDEDSRHSIYRTPMGIFQPIVSFIPRRLASQRKALQSKNWGAVLFSWWSPEFKYSHVPELTCGPRSFLFGGQATINMLNVIAC